MRRFIVGVCGEDWVGSMRAARDVTPPLATVEALPRAPASPARSDTPHALISTRLGIAKARRKWLA